MCITHKFEIGDVIKQKDPIIPSESKWKILGIDEEKEIYVIKHIMSKFGNIVDGIVYECKFYEIDFYMKLAGPKLTLKDCL